MENWVYILAGDERPSPYVRDDLKTWIAKLVGINPKSNLFEREFLSTSQYYATIPCLFEVCHIFKVDYGHKIDYKSEYGYCCIAEYEGKLSYIGISAETCIEILKSGRSISEISPYKNADSGLLKIVRNGDIQWATPSDPTLDLPCHRHEAVATIRELMHGVTDPACAAATPEAVQAPANYAARLVEQLKRRRDAAAAMDGPT